MADVFANTIKNKPNDLTVKVHDLTKKITLGKVQEFKLDLTQKLTYGKAS